MTTDAGRTVVLDGLRRLDLRPAEARLASLDWLGTEQLPSGHRRRRLEGWRDLLLYLDDDGIRPVRRPGAPRLPGAVAARGVALLAPSLDTGPLVLMRDGRLLLWQGDGPGQEVWRTDSDWRQLGLLRLPDGALHVRHFGSGTTEVLEPTGRRRWERPELSLGLLALPGSIIERDLTDKALVRATDPATGTQLWKLGAPDRVERLVAALGGRLWLVMTDDQLVAVDLSTGKVDLVRPIPGLSAVTGPVTPDAKYYLCSGFEISVVDLAADGDVLSRHEFEVTEHSSGGSEFTRVASDGRVVFADDHRRVWVATPDDLGRPQQLTTVAQLISAMEIHDGCLFLLTADGALSVYGGPS